MLKKTFFFIFQEKLSKQDHSEEAVVQGCSVKKVFLETSQNSQENICARTRVLRTPVPQACNFIKKETLAQVFSYGFCEISKNIFFHRTPLVGAPAANGCPKFPEQLFCKISGNKSLEPRKSKKKTFCFFFCLLSFEHWGIKWLE